MIIRSPKDDTMIDDYLGKDDVARISHGKEEFTIRDGWTKITAKCVGFSEFSFDFESSSNLNNMLQNPLTAPTGNPSLFLVRGGKA